MQKTELHRHLDAAFRPSTLAELVRSLKISAPFQTEKEVRTKFWITEQMGSLAEVLNCFVIFQKCLANLEILERVAFEAVEDAKHEDISHIELRYSPSFTSEFSGISWDDALSAFLKGATRASKRTGVRFGFICIVSRDYGEKMAEKTIEFAVANREKFVGVDLAGSEIGFPCKIFKNAFRKAQDAKIPVTIHAGEAAGPENIWEAIDLLGARRIGHGIHAIADQELMKRLSRDQILLEVCPTSNYVTRSVSAWAEHPLPKFLEAGIPVSVNTDDPGIFGVTLPEEYERCKKYLGLTESDLKKIDQYARKFSFISE